MSARAVVPKGAEAPSLTVDQMRLLGMIADGLSVQRIGRCLGLKPAAAWKRIDVLRRRLGVQTNAQLVHRAHMLGFLAPAAPTERRAVPSTPRPEPVALPAPRPGLLSPKPRCGPDDARRIARRLEAGFKGAQR